MLQNHGCLYFTQASLKSLNFLSCILEYSSLQTSTENTSMYLSVDSHVKKFIYHMAIFFLNMNINY